MEVRPRSVLLLMPHCLQDKDCLVKITHRVQNCKRCGKCSIKDLLGLAEKYGVHIAVATGGTIARRIVIETRPDLIIAVACERDLTSGIQDTTPLPVYGIFNQRPFGPCLNTQVALSIGSNPFLPVLPGKVNSEEGALVHCSLFTSNAQKWSHHEPWLTRFCCTWSRRLPIPTG